MVELHLGLVFAVRDRDGRMLPPEHLHDQAAQLMAALLDLEKCNDGMKDPATASDATSGEVTVEVCVAATSDLHALGLAQSLARTAIHTIGGSTPNWPPAPTSAADSRTDFRPTQTQIEYVCLV